MKSIESGGVVSPSISEGGTTPSSTNSGESPLTGDAWSERLRAVREAAIRSGVYAVRNTPKWDYKESK